MPDLDNSTAPHGGSEQPELSFPPVTSEHIQHCSYDFWYPKYRALCVKSRIVPLSDDFLQYIREDGIILADEDGAADDEDDWEPTSAQGSHAAPEDSSAVPADAGEDEEADEGAARLPPNVRFPELHQKIEADIVALGGAVAPKLNWSAPKDATWISRHKNMMKCTSANDVYLLLKSSSFVSHDLEHAFDDTVSPSSSSSSGKLFNPVLVLRSFSPPLPSLEFRCFVKDRTLVAITQRDLNYYSFLNPLQSAIIARIQELFSKLRFTFPEGSFVFDVYIPEADYDDEQNRLGRARLVDINPWAPRTDTLLFGWSELLETRVPRPLLGMASDAADPAPSDNGDDTTTDDDTEDNEEFEPELRLVEKDDPAAYNFSSPQYSAHKLPKEVVDASMAGEGGLREFAEEWRNFVNGAR